MKTKKVEWGVGQDKRLGNSEVSATTTMTLKQKNMVTLAVHLYVQHVTL